MWKHLRVCAIVIALATGCSRFGKGPFKWQTFNAPDGSFSVELPGAMKQETRQQGPLTVTMYGSEVRNGMFGVAVCDLPRGVPVDYAAGVQGVANSHNGTILTQSPWKFDGHEGRAYEIKITNPNGYASGRMAAVNGRLYQMLVMGSNYRDSDAEVQKFFASFKLTPKGRADRQP
jgi:hypothetical protein